MATIGRKISAHRREEVEPEVTFNGSEKVSSHPAFGSIHVYRTQGGHRHLYGSDFVHNTAVAVEIHNSELHRGLSYDRHYARDMVTRVVLSESQWAAFVSASGVGEGVQCTFDIKPAEPYTLDSVPHLPRRDETDDFVVEGVGKISGVIEELDRLEKELEGDLKGLSKAARAQALYKVQKARNRLAESLPFVEKSFLERIEERVVKAKTEIGAWIDQTIIRRGLEAIAADRGKPFELEDKSHDDEHGAD